jgi:phosphoglycerol transferase MdoB-like AlkP superfamily enzyme
MREHQIISSIIQSTWFLALVRAGGFLMALYAYGLFMEDIGGFSTDRVDQQLIELAFVLYLYALFYVILKPHVLRSVLAGIPILLAYLVHDLFYLAFGKVFRLINIGELPELLQILPASFALLFVALLILPGLLFLSGVDYRRPGKLVQWLLPLIILAFSIKVSPDAFAYGFERVAADIVKYSDAKGVENNGRLAMLLYREAQRSSSLDQLEPYRDRRAYEQQAAALIAELRPQSRQRNIHLIVLESFLDPRLFRDLRFSSPPVHPAFEKLFGDKLGLSRAPVFGGATAQSEFELLCGVPAFEALSSIEFNVFSGAAAHCLPGQLKALDYRSVATNTYKPNFFNALPAYQGMGFSESYFPREFSGAADSYLSFGEPGVEEYLFDRSLFEQNLGFVRAHLQQHPDRPLFNYLLTIYGHTPHILDLQQRPERIQLQSHYPDDHLQRTANQFYYRTEAIADYIDKLVALDKESLIILVADHVPPLRNGPNTYNALRYLDNREHSYYYNRLAIIENGDAVSVPEMHHYEMPVLILNSLSDGEHCRNHACEFLNGNRQPREAYMNSYLQLMAHASE